MTERRRRILFFVLLLITVGFAVLTVLVHMFPQSALDIAFSRRIQAYQNPFLDKLMFFISTPGYMPESPILIAVTALAFLAFKYKKAALYVALTALTGLVSTIVKALVNRPRPSDTLVRIVLKTSQQSFPSGHMMFYVIFFGFLTILMYQLDGIPKWLRALVIFISGLFIFLIPISRIYLGAHWFTDVVGGFLLGLIGLYALAWFYLRNRADKKEAPVAETK